MEKIDLSTNSKKIKESYEKVVRGDPSASYVVYTVDKGTTLSVSEIDSGSLDDFVRNFEDGCVQFGLARVNVAGSNVFKNLLVGWCPDSAPTKARLSFASNFADVSKVLQGYHVQITARDQDDLNVDEFAKRVADAAGARYSGSTSSTLTKKPISPKPFVATTTSKKVAPMPTNKPIIPKTTGKPIGQVSSQQNEKQEDEWGGEKEIEERDFEKNPLVNVPSAYKPTKVDMNELRKQKSETTSSQPKPFKPTEEDEQKSYPSNSSPLDDRFKTFDKNESSDGRLTSLPKPKVANSIANRFKTTESPAAPSFGAKPSYGTKTSTDVKSDKLVGGLSRNFASESGKTPAQIWAEKRGKYKSVSPDAENLVSSENDKLRKPFESLELDDSNDNHDDEVSDTENSHVKPTFSSPGHNKTVSNISVSYIDNETEEGDRNVEGVQGDVTEDAEFSEEVKKEPTIIKPASGGIPFSSGRNFTSTPLTEVTLNKVSQVSDKEVSTRGQPQSPTGFVASEKPTPLSDKETEATKISDNGTTAIAEYDYEKDEDNEVEFVEGDLIVDIDFVDEEWWSGKNSRTGETGLFPAAYVSLKDNVEEVGADIEAPRDAPAKLDETKGASARAEYDYEKDEENEIDFDEGDLIVEIEFVDDDWWRGKHLKTGDVGLFPANYVKLTE